MKARSVKLREAHKCDAPAFCSILWDLDQAHHLVTAASSDASVAIHDQSAQPPKPPKTLRHHKDGVTSLALSPDSTCLASASVDHSVKLYAFPGGEFQSNVTRFTLPIRCLAFNKSGSLLAAAGDDDGIKLIATIDSSIARVLKGHKGAVTGLSFDPKNEFLASVDGIGTVIYWELSSGKPVHTLKSIAPGRGLDESILNVLSWSPDGETLAVPGLKNDVVMYDRDTAEKLFSLKGDHEQSVCFLAWSPNGKYMATAGMDMQVLIWDLHLRQDIDRQKFDERISCLAWKPVGNALAVVDAMGKFGVWELPIPSYMKSPTDGVPSLQVGNRHLFTDDDSEELSTSPSLNDRSEDGPGDLAPSSHKRLRKQSEHDENLDEDGDVQDDLLHHIETRKRSDKRKDKNRIESREYSGSSTKLMQETFQPCSTPVQPGKRRFLCYNMLGTITTMENDGYSHIEVDFHDTGISSRVPSMTDYFGFTMASLNESGSVFANPCRGEKSTSTLMYRPFSSWANNSEWSMRFDTEEVKVVALGTGWVAAVTNLNFLRIFTEGGLQKYILSLSGSVVTTAGFKDELAIVTHASECLPSGDQMLEVKVFNISNGTQPIRCSLPLTPGSTLSWFGFSEEGQLSSYDSQGVLRVFVSQFGGSWLPLFSASKMRKSDEETYWVVGLNMSKLFCIVCKSPDSYPLVTPKPVLTLMSLSFPVVSSDLGATDLENEFIMCNLNLSQIQTKIEETATVGLDTSALDDEAFNMEAALDRCILRLIANCCNGDKLVRATELANSLLLQKSIKGAIKLVTALKLPILGERFNSILEERLLNETRILPVQNLVSKTTIPNLEPPATSSSFEHYSTYNASYTPENVKGSEPMVVAPTKGTSPPHFSKQEKTEDKIKMGENSKTATNTSEKKLKEVLQVQSVRPVNPFVKSSNNQDKSSLFDSIKKMKKADSDKTEATNKRIKV
uniref:WD repeat and HMG-box DNA-binding protein 1 n=1 Tax=Anthurium amnicola TaxID=1678845 RepID=A0A1D1ZIT4_9ARAE